MREKSCCFTGHRVVPVQYKKAVCNGLVYEIIHLIEKGYTDFYAGGALGFDTLAAQAVIKLRDTYPQIRLNLALPCRDQDARWNESDREVYREIIRQADSVMYVRERYTRGCMFERNRLLVDNSSACLAFMTKATGGTAYTVRYASEKGIRVVNLAENCV